MTDTNTSGADVLAVLGLADARTGSRAVGHDGPDRDEWEDYVEVPSGKLAEFAALIARNAELEAERDEAACLASDVVGSLRIIKDVVASIAAERDALADEVKALDSEACKLRGELYTLRNMLEGYEVSVQRNQLHGAGLTYLTEVQLFREFQPGVGESHAEWWKKTLARASSATGGGNG